jgi:hypothetical protein
MKMQSNMKRSLTLKQIYRIAVAVFLILAIFFLALPPAYHLSFYRQVLILFKLQESFNVYIQVSYIVHIISLGTALLLIAFFHKADRELQKTVKFVSIDFALGGFIIQASIALWLHRYSLNPTPPVTHGIGWLVFDMMVWFLSTATAILFIASLALAIHHRVSRSFGLTVSVLLLIAHMINLLFGSWSWFKSSIDITLVLTITSVMSIYYLWKSK